MWNYRFYTFMVQVFNSSDNQGTHFSFRRVLYEGVHIVQYGLGIRLVSNFQIRNRILFLYFAIDVL